MFHGLSHLLSPGKRPGGRWRRTAVLSWAGMRGVVTLAAAGAIPYTTSAGDPFPARDVIQFVASVITVATILVQGTTLPWLVRRLDLPGPDPAEDALEEAALLSKATRAGLAKLE